MIHPFAASSLAMGCRLAETGSKQSFPVWDLGTAKWDPCISCRHRRSHSSVLTSKGKIAIGRSATDTNGRQSVLRKMARKNQISTESAQELGKFDHTSSWPGWLLDAL